MKKSKAPKLSTGDSVFKYLGMNGVGNYKVIGKREYPDNIQYEVECQNCTHGYKCQVLITLDDHGQYKYVAMLNDDEDDSQYYWHNTGTFFLTSAEAKIAEGERWIREHKEKLAKLEEQVQAKKKRIGELEVFISELKKELEP